MVSIMDDGYDDGNDYSDNNNNNNYTMMMGSSALANKYMSYPHNHTKYAHKLKNGFLKVTGQGGVATGT